MFEQVCLWTSGDCVELHHHVYNFTGPIQQIMSLKVSIKRLLCWRTNSPWSFNEHKDCSFCLGSRLATTWSPVSLLLSSQACWTWTLLTLPSTNSKACVVLTSGWPSLNQLFSSDNWLYDWIPSTIGEAMVVINVMYNNQFSSKIPRASKSCRTMWAFICITAFVTGF